MRGDGKVTARPWRSDPWRRRRTRESHPFDDRGDGSVLVVEHRAHVPNGHLPNRFAELADGFLDAGTHVEVLTALGWALATAGEARWPLHTYSRPAAALFRLAEKARTGSARRRRVATVLRTVVMVHQVRRHARAMGPGPVGIVSVSVDALPSVVGLAGGRHRWVVHLFGSDPLVTRDATATEMVRRWRARAGRPVARVTLAVPTDSWVPLGARLSSFAVLELPLAGTRPVTAEPSARRLLGIESTRPVALLFASNHRQQLVGPVFDAFRARSDWQLVVAGRAADAIDERDLAVWPVPPVRLSGPGGFVDDRTRELAFQSADLVVLSFRNRYQYNSGTLMDALSHGRPVLVSSGARVADLVEKWGAGMVFSVGSPEALRDALDVVDLAACRAGAQRMRAALSNRSVAEAHLAALRR